MSKKPFFDSEEGKAFFAKMMANIEELRKLREQTKSTDPKVRNEAIKQLDDAIAQAKNYFEEIQKGKVENLMRMREMIQNPENLSSEQIEQKKHMEDKFQEIFSHKEPHKKSHKKSKKNWKKS